MTQGENAGNGFRSFSPPSHKDTKNFFNPLSGLEMFSRISENVASWEGLTKMKRKSLGVRRLAGMICVCGSWMARTMSEPTQPPSPSDASKVVSNKASENVSPAFFNNGEMEEPLDKKGRVPFWTEEKEGWPGIEWKKEEAGGEQKLDAEIKHGGNQSLKLSPRKNWCAVGSINYTVWEWSDLWQGHAWTQCDAGARARLLVIWSEDDLAKIIRVDQSPEARPPETKSTWSEIFTGPLSAPSGATQFRLVLLAAGGSVWFDDARLEMLPPTRPLVKVLVNQVGYDLGRPKSAVIATNFVTADGGPARVEILDAENKKRGEISATCSGRIFGQNHADWGWYFWRADFSSFDREGNYKLKATVGKGEGTSFPFAIGKDLIFSKCAPMDVDFFFVQRCGFAVPGWHDACHMDDAKMPDGSHRDLTGGWHSAGDYNKLPWEYGDGAATYALANAMRLGKDVLSSHDRDHDGIPDALDEALWGAKFLSKIQIPETGGLLGDIWQGPNKQAFFQWLPPDRHTDNKIGTPDDPIVASPTGNTPLAIAGLVLAGRLSADGGQDQGHVNRAVSLLNYCKKQPGREADPHVLLGAIELVRAGQVTEREFARKCATAIIEQSESAGRIKGGYSDSGDVPCAALAEFALAFPDDPLAPRIKSLLAKQLEFFLAEPDNPFGVAREKPGPDGYFFEPTSVYGQNFLYSSRAWGAISIYRVTGDRRALVYAVDQLDWLLGKNPYNLCMMEGLGSLNPPRYHHRYDSIPGHERGAVPGTIPNGFVRDIGGYDRPGFDMSKAGRPHPSYRTSEPWLVHNILNLLAITSLHAAEIKPKS